MWRGLQPVKVSTFTSAPWAIKKHTAYEGPGYIKKDPGCIKKDPEYIKKDPGYISGVYFRGIFKNRSGVW